MQYQTRIKQLESRLKEGDDQLGNCLRDVQEERSRAAARKPENCEPCKEELLKERDITSHLKAEVDKLKIQLEYATHQLQNPTPVVPKQDDILQHPPRRAEQDDSVDAAIVDREREEVNHEVDHLPQEIQKHEAAPRRRWGRGTKAPDEQQGKQQDEESRAPETKKARRKRRNSGLSMLEEHLGMVHNDDGQIIYENHEAI